MKFLRNFIAALLALIVFSGIILVLIIGAVMDDGVVTVKEGSVLHINMNLPVTEREVENPLEGIPVAPGPASSIGLVEFRKAVEQAATDENIRGIYLELDNLQAGITSVEELRNTILAFRESGKFVVAYAKYYSEPAYYLASAADEVHMHPEGDVEFNGLAANLTFFKGTFEKLEIEPQIFRVGDFKSAVEPLTREDMSEENELQLRALITSVNSYLLENVASSRNLSPDSVQRMNNNYLVRSSQDAVRYGLVDHLSYKDQLLKALSENSGKDAGDEPELISYQKYQDSFVSDLTSKNKIAMIVAAGDIVSGKGDFASVGGEKFSKEVRKAREDDNVKAIVIRINSPGGSFVASDVIWREVALAAEEKPVIASMGDAAASGGYYIAMACDTIVANPTTVTGSIGIFSILFNLKGFLNNKLGITTDAVTTGEFSNMYTSDRPLTARERSIIQNEIEASYNTFIAKAARGRNMSEDAIREVASGRVWSGIKAKEIGLVDVLGDTREAVRLAAEAAGIADDYRVTYQPPQESFLDMLFGEQETRISEKALREELGALYPYLEQVKRLERLRGIQARSMYELEIN